MTIDSINHGQDGSSQAGASPQPSLTDDTGASAAHDEVATLRYYASLSPSFSISSALPSNTSGGSGSPSLTTPSAADTTRDTLSNLPRSSDSPAIFTSDAHGGPGGGSGGGSGGGGGTPKPYTASGNGLTFVINWDSSVGKAPSAFTGAFETAVGYFLGNLSSPVQPITITLDVGWGEAGGKSLPFGALGESLTNIYQVPYSGLLQTSLSSYLPTSDPIVASHYYWVASAEEKALGITGNNTSLDGSVGFGSRVAWNYTATTGSGYDFISVAEHEISETMGRIALVGGTISDSGTNYANSYTPFDLMRYSAPGTLSLVGGKTAYFSYDFGKSSNGNSTSSTYTYFNTTLGGDPGDWNSTGNTPANDAYNAFASSGVLYQTTAVDKNLMNVLGYGPAPAVS